MDSDGHAAQKISSHSKDAMPSIQRELQQDSGQKIQGGRTHSDHKVHCWRFGFPQPDHGRGACVPNQRQHRRGNGQTTGTQAHTHRVPQHHIQKERKQDGSHRVTDGVHQ